MSFLFLHGFLGGKEDWSEVIQHLPFSCHPFDLPGHGQTPFTPDFISYFDAVSKQYAPFHLVGYSMGGRLALQFAKNFPVASLTLISTHLGLKTAEERKQRLEHDRKLAKEILELPIDEFLTRWYDQPLFKSLMGKVDIKAMRQRQNREGISKAIEAYSLGHQDDYSDSLPPNTHLLAGELDEAYRHRGTLIPDAGHAIHLEQPLAVAEFLKKVIS
jgi:2-succinyl-6-hydroxy-2,4-cyclohexadiene-1-carboxylate synthase